MFKYYLDELPMVKMKVKYANFFSISMTHTKTLLYINIHTAVLYGYFVIHKLYV